MIIASLLRSQIAQWIVMAAMLLGLPAAGILLEGKELSRYLRFPPLTGYVEHAPFSWVTFTVYAAVDAAGIVFVFLLLMRGARRRSSSPRRTAAMPAWGWVGLAVMLLGWFLAWTRMEWFAPLQRHTFVLPWIGYIFLVNALCVRLSGRSLLTDAPARFWALFPASAAFWWFFEYLNRFVQNWTYAGVRDFSPAAYVLFASLAFSTVLPAVLSTFRLLLVFGPFNGLQEVWPVRFPRPRAAAVAVLILAASGLFFLGIYPNWLFAFLWISPLLIITSMQTLSGRPTIFTPLTRGDWRGIVTAAVAALVCGFFWEMWNIGSLARWEYHIPHVERFRVFAMPLLGYGGYLPFGLECLVIGALVVGYRELSLEVE